MRLPDFDLRYVDSGSGDPLVLLDWTPWPSPVLADALAQNYRVISIQPPDGSGSARTAPELAMAASRIVTAAGLGPHILAGASLGADLALRLALLQPTLVNALALVSPTCVHGIGSRPADMADFTPEAMLAHPDCNTLDAPDPARTMALSELAKRWKETESDAADLLPELTCATLVVFGQEDQRVSREAGGTWKSKAPNCSVCYVYDAGHAIAVERPGALLNVIMDFAARRETFIVEKRSSLINP